MVDVENMVMLDMIGNEIEELVYMHDIDYIDACIMYCEENKIDIEQFATAIKEHQQITNKIRREAVDLNFLQKETATEFNFEQERLMNNKLIYIGVAVAVLAVLVFFGAGDGAGLPDWFPTTDGA